MTSAQKIALAAALVSSVQLSCRGGEPAPADLPPAREPSAEPTPPQPVVSTKPEVAHRVATRPDAGPPEEGPGVEKRLARLRVAVLVGAKLISSRTLSARLRLAGKLKAVFKPLRKGDMRALREVAVFRLASHLGVEGVPPSTVRRLPLKKLVAMISRKRPEEAKELETTARTDSKGMVTGAIIEWVRDLDPDRYTALGGRAALKSWLAPARPSGDDGPLAAHASAMVAFDYLTGNWDRFSGGNLFVAGDDERLVLLDHNAAFAPGNKRQGSRLKKLLAATERFPRGLVEGLRKLSAEGVDRALSAEPRHGVKPLVSPAEMKLLLRRRDEIVAHVDRLIATHGAPAVTPFP